MELAGAGKWGRVLVVRLLRGASRASGWGGSGRRARFGSAASPMLASDFTERARTILALANEAAAARKRQSITRAALASPQRSCHRLARLIREALGGHENGPSIVSTVRSEVPSDHDAVRQIHHLAFAGPTEASLVDRLRDSTGSISLVAAEAGVVVGHILFTAARIVGPRTDVRVAALGPMAVSPSRQRKGIGSALVQRGLEECRREGYEAIVVVGHPAYYPRFGFRRGRSFGLRCQFGAPDETFMAAELSPGALSGGGEVRYAPEFSEA